MARPTGLPIDTKAPLVDFTYVTKPPSKLNEPHVEYTPSADAREGSGDHPSHNGYSDTSLPAAEFDQSQLEHNLALTPEERLIEHQHALELVLALEASGRSLRAKSQ
jgi:hypothetical protein